MSFNIYSGQVSSGLNVFDDYMYVSAGGTANKTTLNGSVNFGGRMLVYSGGTANSTILKSNGYLHVSNGGVANSTTVSGGWIFISNGATANSTVIDDGYMDVWAGGVANSTVVNSACTMYVNPNGTANKVVVNAGGRLFVSEDGTALNVVWTPCIGQVTVDNGATVTFASNYRGVYFGSSNKLLSSALTMSGQTLRSSDHTMYVMNGGTATATTMNGGYVYVSSGGTVNSTTVNEYGDLYVYHGGVANKTTVSYGWVDVIGGTANSTTLNSCGGLLCCSSGVLNFVTVNNYGYLALTDGTVANSVVVNNGGCVEVENGGRLTGTLTLAADAIVSAYAGSIIDFDVSAAAPGGAVLVNNLSLIDGSPNFTITVAANQTAGTYNLAAGATGFNRTITVKNTSGNTLGTISVGGTLSTGNHNYALRKNGDNLTLTASFSDPYESNDTAATAYDLGKLSGERTLTGGSVAPASDADWFKFTLDNKGTANDYIQIAFDHRAGDLDLYLYGANGTTLLQSSVSTSSDTERISLKGLAKGTYFVKAAGKNGAMNSYILSTKKVDGYDPDVYDAKSRNDSMATATVLDVGKTAKNTVSGLNLHESGDIDYYRIVLSTAGVRGDSVSIDFAHSAGDLDLYLYNSAGDELQCSIGVGNSESVSFAGLAAGTYYVEVSAPYGAVNEYSLNWNFTPNTVAADAYEGKEPIAIAQSTVIAGLTISPASTGVTQTDTFTITLAAAGTSAAKIRFSNYRSDWTGLKYTIKNSGGTIVRSGTSAEITLEGLAKGSYTLTVDTPVAGTYGAYDISVSLPEAVQEKKKWTYLVYMAADSNLEDCALYDIVAMQKAQLDADIDIYVLVDRPSDPRHHNDSSVIDGQTYYWDSDWTDTRVGKISYSPGNTVGVKWQSWGEKDTSDITVLADFINWGKTQSVSENYGLIMWDHGAEDATLCQDMTSNGMLFTINALASVLARHDDIPLVIFNNCLLGSEIVATQLAGSTDIAVVSEPPSWAYSKTYAYNTFFTTITSDMTAGEMASVIVANVNEAAGGPSMLSALDVTDTRLADALDSLYDVIKNSTNREYELVSLIHGLFYTANTGCSYEGLYGTQSDLLETIKLTRRSTYFSQTSLAFRTALNNIENVLNDIVLCSKSLPTGTGYGVAIFNPIITAKIYSLSGISYQEIDGFLQSYISQCYGKNQKWGLLLYSLADFYHLHFENSFGGPATFSSFAMNGGLDPANGASIYSVDLGCFSGKGMVIDGITILQQAYFQITVTDAEHSSGKISVSSENAENITLSIIDATGKRIATGNNSVTFSSLAAGDYNILMECDNFCYATMEYDANWATGCDRFDYAQSGLNRKNVNGNGSREKATELNSGYYSGLATYAGDSDWYLVGNIYTSEYLITVKGSGLTVAEYDSNGNLIQTAAYSNGKYTMTMESLNYLYVEGNANIGKNAVNAYSLSISAQLGIGRIAAAPVASDLNGDGRADVIMSIVQAGHGAKGATGAWLIQGNHTAVWGDLSQRNNGWSIFGTGYTAAGKSTSDVYVKSTGNVIGAWTTDANGKVTGWQTVGSFDNATQVLGLGDFNADGQTDLLLRNVNGAVGCYFTSGAKTGWNYFQSLGNEWKITAVGDLNGDGRDDVVLKHDAGFAGSWLTQTDGTMAWADLDTLPAGFAIVGAGDFDGDGTDDVLLKKGNYYGAWLVQNGNAKSWMGLGDLGNVTVEQIADFDADGRDDLRIRTAAGDLGAQLVKGADTLTWKYYGSVGSEWSTSLAAL